MMELMTQYRITCPDCGGAIVTAYPEAMIWELCPVCMRHIWDRYDVWLADAHAGAERGVSTAAFARMNN